MSWIEELGENEITDKHAKVFVDLIDLTAEVNLTTEEAVREQLIEYTDTAIKNLEKIRKAAQNGK